MQEIRLCTSITRLLMSAFIDADVDHDYRGLVISGEPTEEELLHAWMEIKQQFSDAIGGEEKAYQISLYGELVYLKIRVQNIEKLVAIMRKYYVREFASELNKVLGRQFKFDVKYKTGYDADLDKCLALTIPMKLNIREREDELKDFQMDGEDVVSFTPTREYYARIFITLSDHAKRDIDEGNTTAFTFCERVKRYNDHVRMKQSKDRDE